MAKRLCASFIRGILFRVCRPIPRLRQFHSQWVMPWMLPGISPTNRHVEVALVAIVRFRDGKLAHEHIYWDQASVLKQIGLLADESLPVRGVETAEKVRLGSQAC